MIAATRPIMILAGGTGGHVYPALAVAQRLQKKGVPVVWMGTRRGLEARVVPQAGIPIDWLSVSGLRGKRVFTWLLAPLRLNVAISQALMILLRHKPRLVLGMGGFVAGPGGLMAFVLSKPLVLHEQNAVAGLTNRLLAPLCDRLLEGLPGAFKSAQAKVVGNPVRREIAELPPPEQRIAGRVGRLRLLILGGSLGAQALNEVVPEALKILTAEERPDVWHQTGPTKRQAAEQSYDRCGVQGKIEDYIEDMATAYAWADLVLCRAGALTIAELATSGVASILVPYPYAVDDHQTANARILTAGGGAVLLQQSDLSAARLASLLKHFSRGRQELVNMALAARALAMPNAAETVAEICLEASGGSHTDASEAA